MFALVTYKIGMDKNGPKLLEKGKLQMYGIDKIAHDFSYVELYSINTFSGKSLIRMRSLMKASCALFLNTYCTIALKFSEAGMCSMCCATEWGDET